MITLVRFPAALLLVLGAIACHPKVYISNAATQNTRVSDSLSVDNRAEATIKPYRDQLDAQMNQVIGICEKDMAKAKPEGELGNFITDAMLSQATVKSGTAIDFAIINYGGIRIPAISQGNLTKGRVYELLPFDNTLLIVDLDAKTTLKLLEKGVADGWAFSAAVRCKVKEGKMQSATLNGKLLDDNQRYKVLMADYIANGGDNADFLKEQPRVDIGLLQRDAVIRFVEAETAAGRKLKAAIEGRVSIEN